MRRKSSIDVVEMVYRGICRTGGPGAFGRLLNALVARSAPFAVAEPALDAEYRAMAADAELEREAREWIEFAPDEGLP